MWFRRGCLLSISKILVGYLFNRNERFGFSDSIQRQRFEFNFVVEFAELSDKDLESLKPFPSILPRLPIDIADPAS